MYVYLSLYMYLYNIYLYNIYNGILFSLKKELIHAICSNMGGPRDNHINTKKVRERKTNST